MTDIAILDDNEAFLATGLLALDQAGMMVHKYSEPEPFIAFVVGHEADLIVFVDHDLGTAMRGYDVVRRVRTDRHDGLITPIVYLTGRETEQGFLEHEADDPYAAPSTYLNKRSLVRTDLVALVGRLEEQNGKARALSDAQALSGAISLLSELTSDDIVER